MQSYYLLTNTLVADFVTNKIIDLYYKNIDVAPHTLVALLYLYIIINEDNHNIEFAFLMSNYIMLKKDRWFLMPYEYCHDDYKKAMPTFLQYGIIIA